MGSFMATGKAALLCMTVLVVPLGCTTLGEKDVRDPSAEAPKPPIIGPEMELEDALKAAIEFGGDTLVNVKRLIRQRNEFKAAASQLESFIEDDMLTAEHHQLLNAGHIYLAQQVPANLDLFAQLVRSERPLANQIGWQLAALKPSPLVAQAMDAELTRAVAGDEERVLIPQMANALLANRLKSNYTLARRGLMVRGAEDFAVAMAALSPKEASDDFLQYLALASPEELRQLTVTSVNPYTCVAILKHMQRIPPSIANAQFQHLYFFAVSRNIGLAELAQNVLEGFVPTNTEQLAQILAAQPTWVQMAFLEGARRRSNPKVSLLLSELKKMSSEDDVVQEIDELKL